MRTALVAAIAGAILSIPSIASAHPLGNFTINVYAGLEIRPGRIDIDYVLDMAEIPTFQALPSIDANDDGVASAAELDAWAGRQAPGLVRGLALDVDGRSTSLRVVSAGAGLRPGQASLDTLRLEATFRARAPSTGSIAFDNGTFADRIGWREISAAAFDGAVIERSTVPSSSVSDRLLAYPQERLQSPLRVTSARIVFARGVSGAAAAPAAVATPGDRPQLADGGFASLVQDRGGWLIVVALLLAVGFGALHALGPGHGKTLMAAYLVGADGRVRQAAAVGTAVAGMHTASVLALGVLVLSAERLFPVERVYVWLGLASGLVAVALGAALLRTRLRSPGAHRHVADAHEHVHGEDLHPHSHPHSHPPVASRRGLVAIALAGGILPSPSALVVLLASISVGRTAFGLALIAAFSLGLAGTLVVVGAVALRARSFVERRGSRIATRFLPIGSAASIVALGAVLTARALLQL